MAKFADDLTELNSILLDPKTPINVIHGTAQFFKRESEFCMIYLEPPSTTDTDKFGLDFKSTDLFLEYMAAMRASDWEKALILVHVESPSSMKNVA